MIVLPNIKSLIEQLKSDSEKIDLIENELFVPRELKNRFGTAWGKGYIAKTDLIKLFTSCNEESNQKSVILVDALLIKCAHAVPLYDGYGIFLEYAEKVRLACSLTREEWKLLGEERSIIPLGVQSRIETAINSIPDLSLESKASLRRFMVAAKSDRESDLGPYKGLSRSDPFQPVAANALGQRIDYSGFINDVIVTLMENREITQELLDLSDRLAGRSGCSITDNFLPEFSDSLRKCGFYTKCF